MANRIQVLQESVARRIAAGEVIDRPLAVLRELLDNAADALASDITVHINGGGMKEIRVSDNGGGMSGEDIKLCWLPHATSKIAALDDLEKITTLGFRGEALSSLAACTRLEIVSAAGGMAHKLVVHGGKVIEQGPSTGSPGTTVSVRDIFFNMPARRQFLKSTQTESSLCQRIFFEKAAAHPGINFRLFLDGRLKTFLSAGTSLERVNACWPRLASRSGWWESEGQFAGGTVRVVHARPEISRRDRKYIHIYVNRRRIEEFSLLQGVCHAYDAWMPGGAFPHAFVFIEIDPKLVDFNIHPAKKEARFRDLPALRHRLIEIIRERISGESYRRRAPASKGADARLANNNETELFNEAPKKPVRYPLSVSTHSSAAYRQGSYSGGAGSAQAAPSRNEAAAFAQAARELREAGGEGHRRFSPAPLEKGHDFRYLGQAMGVFLLAEVDNSLFIVDQHAAHERILFDRLRGAEPVSEPLLLPRPLNLDSAALMRLELRVDRLEKMGIKLACNEEGCWELRAIPFSAKGYEGELADILESGSGDPETFEKELWANLACKAAVKDNTALDKDAAVHLLRDAFNLESPRCPHGRPIWFEISRAELFELLGREV
ncbi:MAG: hypothetical protein B0D92_04940 [Spirochaeta sp. LUC14_002_19_P3]|nr:MAG: hypothetical protein B0D92_04940 [Spirochaeta sp. LUC14_002_19_P3]